MIVCRHSAAECRDGRIFAAMIMVVGSWTAVSRAFFDVDVLDVLPAC